MSTQKKPLRIGLVAGEASGDVLGAGLIRAIKNIHPDAVFEGVAGTLMRQAGCKRLAKSDDLAVMGLVEVLSHLPRLLRLRKSIQRHFLDNPPDVFVGIDAPAFNMDLEANLKKAGIQVAHYVSPSVWAYKPERVHKINRAAHAVLCLLDFEPKYYNALDVKATFVGHPTADDMQIKVDKAAIRESFGLTREHTVVAAMPGSRVGEIKRLGPAFAKALRLLRETTPNLVVLAPAANAQAGLLFKSMCEKHVRGTQIIYEQGRSQRMLQASDAALVASGTATLEAMLAHTPMVMAYKMHPLTVAMLKLTRTLTIDKFSLPNIISGETLVQEFIQNDVTPANLAQGLSDVLANPNEQIAAFIAMHKELAVDANQKAAAAVLDLIDETRHD